MFKLFNSVQELPFQFSVAFVAVAGGDDTSPPKAKQASAFAPAPCKLFLVVFKSATSVQFAPLYSSVSSLYPGLPPKANAEV